MRKLAFLMSLVLGSQALAGEGRNRAAAIAPWIDDQTHTVMCLNLDGFDKSMLDKYLGLAEKLQLLGAKERPAAELAARFALDQLERTKVSTAYLVWSLSKLDEPLLVCPLTKKTDKKLLQDWLKQIPGMNVEERDEYIVAGGAAVLGHARRDKRSAGDLSKAFAAVEGDLFQVVVRPPATLRRALRESMPALPKEFGGAPWETVDDGIQWLALGARLSPKPSVRLIVQAKSAQAAQALAEVVKKGAESIRERKEVRDMFPDIEMLLPHFLPKVVDDRLVVNVAEETLMNVATATLKRVKAAAGEAEARNNLRQLALAMHQYHAVHKRFPAAASYDAKGKPLLSWRVQMLPYVEQQALYQEFKLDEPWDSEHNKKLIAKMPAIFSMPGQANAKDGKTCIQVPVGKGFIFDGKKGVRFQDILDGTSSTIFMVQTDDAHAVPWTKPEDWTYDAKEPLRGLVRAGQDGFHAAFADGSVHRISRRVILLPFLTRSAGDITGKLD
jgi:hypothetical protein